MNAGMTRYLAESLGWLLGLGRLVVHTLVGFISRMVPVPNCFTSTPSTTQDGTNTNLEHASISLSKRSKDISPLETFWVVLKICRLVVVVIIKEALIPSQGAGWRCWTNSQKQKKTQIPKHKHARDVVGDHVRRVFLLKGLAGSAQVGHSATYTFNPTSSTACLIQQHPHQKKQTTNKLTNNQ